MPDQTIYPLFVYGSLMSGFKSPAYEYISRFFNLLGKGKVKGRLYDMGEYPAAIPSAEDVFIQGESYLIKNESEFSWAIGQLDDYEGIIPEPGETPLYRRELTSVIMDDKTITAWIYWYNGSIAGKPHIASGDVLLWRAKKES
jgi:gamma-glutamylcyclotransferase (GGCT)/AIG2-like uncharacterized protein YtfP